MEKIPALRIHIPKPCQQEWNTMTPQVGGRYCTQCTKVVHDFSQMTDTELLYFFKTRPTELCGRFHHQQLNREIRSAIVKRSLPVYLKKLAAAAFAILSLRTATAQAQKTKDKPATNQTSLNGKNPVLEAVTISGRVTKGNDIPVSNARVAIDTVAEVYTDADGKFVIQLSGEKVTTHNLYFSYEGFESAVRNFHPLMGSTDYNVRLTGKEDYRYGFTMGLIASPFDQEIEFPTIILKNQKRLLSTDKQALTLTASILKEHPQIIIQLIAYEDESISNNTAKGRLSLIKNYLIKQLHISPERIFEKIESVGSGKIVDLIQFSKQ